MNVVVDDDRLDAAIAALRWQTGGMLDALPTRDAVAEHLECCWQCAALAGLVELRRYRTINVMKEKGAK